MRAVSLFLIFLVALAGCADSKAPVAEDDGFTDKPLESDATTGIIRGVVVDDSFTPVAGATIVLQIDGGTQETVADAEGRFGYSKVPPGVYFLKASAELHTETQFSATVVAGQAQPPIISVQLVRLYAGDPYVVPIVQDGFFQCSQANTPPYLYSSSPCHSPANGVDLCDMAGACLPQNRDFHADVEAGWQTMVFEMTWESTAQGTSDRMGMSVSTYKPERNTNHWFASVASKNPMRFQLDVGTPHATAQEGSGPMGPVPVDGMVDMSYYISVRSPEGAVCAIWCAPPGLAFDQSFTTYLHQFYYLPAPVEWSIVAGDTVPY